MITKMPQTVSKTYMALTRYLFYCHIKIKIPESYGVSLLNECFNILEKIDRRYNSYQQGSYFYRINQNAGSWVDIDDTCFSIINKLKKISECTKGAYDISCMPLLRLWGFYRKDNHHVPSEKELKDSLQHVDYRTIELEQERVRIASGAELITGSFVKSWAVDQIVAFLKENGVEDAIVNAGGSTIYGMNDSTHTSWKINIPNPLPSAHPPHQVAIENQSFSLSARSNNNITIQNKEYGHILNSITGYPATTLQAGVWSDDAFMSDILSTAIFSVEPEELSMVLARLNANFKFNYFRVEENGSRTTNLCF